MAFYNTVAVVDLNTGKPTKITELVEEVSLVAALKADQFVREAHENQSEPEHARYLAALDAARTLDELSAALAMRFTFSPDDVLRHFAFLDYDSKRNLVAARLVILENPFPGTLKYIQIGLTVAPKKDKRPLFVAAKSGAGFFLEVSEYAGSGGREEEVMRCKPIQSASSSVGSDSASPPPRATTA